MGKKVVCKTRPQSLPSCTFIQLIRELLDGEEATKKARPKTSFVEMLFPQKNDQLVHFAVIYNLVKHFCMALIAVSKLTVLSFIVSNLTRCK